LFSLFAPAVGLAQERTIALDAPLETTLGDPIDVIVTVTAAASDEAAVPDQSFEPFEILGKKVFIAPSPDGKTKTFTFELQLLCFEVGVHELGPVDVRITSAAGELIEVQSNATSIEVHSLLANEPDPQLKPPTDPVVVEQDDYRLLIVLGVLLAIHRARRVADVALHALVAEARSTGARTAAAPSPLGNRPFGAS
jgi:hypothetical protein